MSINFINKLNVTRPQDSLATLNLQAAEQISAQLESDRGRIINSAAVRRLQQKTQVFPLERNAAVRSRLTHSLEVQQNGRYIVKTLFAKLGEKVADYGLQGLEPAVESLVEMACLMHDIGNPPFGHFGEAAINQWFSEKLPTFAAWQQCQDAQLLQQMQTDLQHFEGNAQAIRLTHSLQQMNLSFAQTAAILKYTRGAFELVEQGNKLSQLRKKPGFYLSEQRFVQQMQAALQMQAGHRHPFCYLMEAADDMAYCLADIEDAVEKGIFNLPQLTELLADTFQQVGGKLSQQDILSYDNSHKSFAQILNLASNVEALIDSNHQYFVQLRINLIHHLVHHAAQRFIDHIEAIYHGSFNHALLEDDSTADKLVKTFKKVGAKYVFCHREVQNLELQGYRIITGLLDIYLPILQLEQTDLAELLTGRGKHLYLKLLLNRIDPKHLKAYQTAVHSQQFPNFEFYHRCRLLQDHISSMTDHSIYDEYQKLSVAE